MHFENTLVPTKAVLACLAIGALSGLLLAQLGPGPTLAAVASAPPFSYGKALDVNLARFDGEYFAIGTEPGVSLAPQSSVRIRKIGYGQTSFVSVFATPSGTYSTDGLHSPHIRYPGIHVDPLDTVIEPVSGAVLGWSRLTGWVRIPLFSANSIGILDNYVAPNSRNGVCVTDNATGACR
jgi:hypothetical protein